MPTDIEPPGEALGRAIRWISEHRRDAPDADVKRLVNEAGLRFDLSPAEQEFLWHHLVVGHEQSHEQK